MGLLDNLFSKVTRFHIYFAQNNETKYVFKGQSPIRMLGYIAPYFENGDTPINNWTLHFLSAATRKHFQLSTLHFDKLQTITPKLLEDLTSIDERWKHLKGDKLVFEDFITKKELPVSNTNMDDVVSMLKKDNLENLIKQMNQKDLFAVLDEIFGK